MNVIAALFRVGTPPYGATNSWFRCHFGPVCSDLGSSSSHCVVNDQQDHANHTLVPHTTIWIRIWSIGPTAFVSCMLPSLPYPWCELQYILSVVSSCSPHFRLAPFTASATAQFLLFAVSNLHHVKLFVFVPAPTMECSHSTRAKFACATPHWCYRWVQPSHVFSSLRVMSPLRTPTALPYPFHSARLSD